MKKLLFSLFAFLLLSSALVFSISFANQQDENDPLLEILETTREQYDVEAHMVQTEDATLYFVIGEEEDRTDVRNFVELNLKSNDLEEYSIIIEKESDYEF
ncbi:hypothetical protein [Evansella clarkii]|uniref:hypothetical protein n=1 Tax=Evansella clarkii TaxID=79879 RepID=UPI0009973D41|nr:hypothetical protein [Evansella clarkii]